MQEKENVLRILRETLEAIKREDAIKLKDLSNQTIHTASLSQDPDNIAIAVIVYSLSKIIERTSYKDKMGWGKFYKNTVYHLEHSIRAIERNNEKHLRTHLEGISKKIGGISGKLKKYIQEVFMKAQINKASRIYEHGISMEKTAKLLGITLWDLASYAGQTGIADVNLGKTMEIKNRIKIAEEIFR
jgi:hypothetical protein